MIYSLASLGLLAFVSFVATRYAMLAIILTYFVPRGH